MTMAKAHDDGLLGVENSGEGRSLARNKLFCTADGGGWEGLVGWDGWSVLCWRLGRLVGDEKDRRVVKVTHVYAMMLVLFRRAPKKELPLFCGDHPRCQSA